METVTLLTESYLFQNAEGQFRAIPFYELSIHEWIIFESGHPRFLLDFNRRKKPLIQDLNKRLENGEDLDEAVQRLGIFLGREWTIKHNIEGAEVPDSFQSETVTVTFLDDLADLFMDVMFVATDIIDTSVLLNEEKFLEVYLENSEEKTVESAYAENQDDLVRMLAFFFQHPVSLIMLASNAGKEIYDLTSVKNDCITFDEFDQRYEQWIDESNRTNSMDQYGMAMSVISLINNNLHKQHLILIAEKRKHW